MCEPSSVAAIGIPLAALSSWSCVVRRVVLAEARRSHPTTARSRAWPSRRAPRHRPHSVIAFRLARSVPASPIDRSKAGWASSIARAIGPTRSVSIAVGIGSGARLQPPRFDASSPCVQPEAPHVDDRARSVRASVPVPDDGDGTGRVRRRGPARRPVVGGQRRSRTRRSAGPSRWPRASEREGSSGSPAPSSATSARSIEGGGLRGGSPAYHATMYAEPPPSRGRATGRRDARTGRGIGTHRVVARRRRHGRRRSPRRVLHRGRFGTLAEVRSSPLSADPRATEPWIDQLRRRDDHEGDRRRDRPDRPGPRPEGADAIEAWAAGEGVQVEALDGSGLSHLDHVSAIGVVTLLLRAQR